MMQVPLLELRQAMQTALAFTPRGEAAGWVWLIPAGEQGMVVTGSDHGFAAVGAWCPGAVVLGDAAPVALSRQDAERVLAVFHLPKDKESWPSCAVELTDRGEEVTFTLMASGAVPDMASAAQRPAIAALQAVLAGERWQQHTAQHYALSPGRFPQIATACKAYQAEAYLELRRVGATSKRPYLLATIGQWCTALISLLDPDSDGGDSTDPAAWQKDWRALVGDLEAKRAILRAVDGDES